jgi:hypothetical protein
MGEDQGCFASALCAVRNYGGVLEHPAHSHAFNWFGVITPKSAFTWTGPDQFGGWVCQVEQGHYGHLSRKATWLYACKTERPEMTWGHLGNGSIQLRWSGTGTQKPAESA